MDVPLKEQKILLMKSGNKCASPGCQAVLVQSVGISRRQVVTGEIAHIVSASPDGPRGNHYLPPGEHDKYNNLIALCAEHHTVVDSQPHIYTVERLRQMKQAHEEAVARVVTQAKGIDKQDGKALPYVREIVHSTLLPVLKMPRYVYGAPCKYGDSNEKDAAKEVLIPEGDELCPFIIREGTTLFAFNNLRYEGGPFRDLVKADRARRWRSQDWWEHPDKSKWYRTLLNRALNKLTGRTGLRLDKEHHRYFFQHEQLRQELKVRYRPLNQESLVERSAVWQPRSKKTGEPRPFWNHLAVNLRFLEVGKKQWCLCMRPEMRITRDGREPIEARETGSRVTRQKSHMFNYELLEDVNFWRDFLSGGRPRIILSFGPNEKLVISTTLMASEVGWPGIPEEFAKPFKNIEYEEDLFSLAELRQLGEQGEEAEGELGEDEEAEGLDE